MKLLEIVYSRFCREIFFFVGIHTFPLAFSPSVKEYCSSREMSLKILSSSISLFFFYFHILFACVFESLWKVSYGSHIQLTKPIKASRWGNPPSCWPWREDISSSTLDLRYCSTQQIWNKFGNFWLISAFITAETTLIIKYLSFTVIFKGI